MTKQSGFVNVLITLIVLVALAAGGIYYWQQSKLPAPPADPIVENQPPANDETKDWETYRNEEYGFEIKYPSEIIQGIIKKADKSPVAPESLFSIVRTAGDFNYPLILTSSSAEAYKSLAGEEVFFTRDGLSVKRVCAICEGPGPETSFDYFIFDGVGNRKVSIFYRYSGSPSGHPTVAEFEQMISTFKFIN